MKGGREGTCLFFFFVIQGWAAWSGKVASIFFWRMESGKRNLIGLLVGFVLHTVDGSEIPNNDLGWC